MQNTVKAKAPTARAIAIETHDKAGFTGGTYAGLSKTRNAGNTTAPNLSTSKAAKREFAKLTPRMLSTLRDLAAKYQRAAFPLPGIDRGQAAIFLASGYFVAAGEAKAKLAFGALPKPLADGKPVAFYHVPETFLPNKPPKAEKPAKPAAEPEAKPETPAA